MAINLAKALESNNLAESLDADKLKSIGSSLCAAIAADDLSREKWLKDNDKWLKLAQQVIEEKSYPWQGASNIKYPTLSIAAIQFHAQAFPTLLGRPDIVKCKQIGVANEQKKARCERVGKFMSYQVVDLMDNWIEDMDRLLLVLAIVGLLYKKTYYSDARQKSVSELVQARDLILNYNAKNYNRARKTHRMWMDDNELYEATAAGEFLELDLGTATQKEVPGTRDMAIGLSSVESEQGDEVTTPREIYESHCWLDLDEDGYKEPYIVTLDKDTTQVLRIVARWRDESSVVYNGSRLVRIEPEEYFTAYRFFPDPESSVYGLGFGRLLGPSNTAVNGLINMLMDAGHLSTLGGGFIGRNARISGGTIRTKPAEWIQVQSTGDDLRKSIVPHQYPEPSAVLFQLLGMMIGAGKDLSTVQDVFMGKNPGQNQPYATTQEVINQGLKVFNGIYKRVYASMSQEFAKLYILNFEHLKGIEYQQILDDPAADINDFALDGLDIIPSAEPDMIQEHEKIMKANALIGKLQAGMKMNTQEVLRRTLEAEGHENIEALMTLPPEPPSPDMLKLQLEAQKFQHQQIMDQMTAVLEKVKVQSQAYRDEANAIAVVMNANTAAKAEDRAAMTARLDQINKEREHVMEMATKQTDLLLAHMQSKDAEKDREVEREKNAATRKSASSEGSES